MRGYIVRKILILFIFIIPAVSYSGCKKQARCGCGKDVIKSFDEVNNIQLLDYSQLVYAPDGSIAYFFVGYDKYLFCNPVGMLPEYQKLTKGDQIFISGDAFWECNYLYSSSNYQYQSSYRVYNINVTGMRVYLYGKK